MELFPLMFVGLVRNQKVITVIRCFVLKYVKVIIVIKPTELSTSGGCLAAGTSNGSLVRLQS